jgi:hypothetical protein
MGFPQASFLPTVLQSFRFWIVFVIDKKMGFPQATVLQSFRFRIVIVIDKKWVSLSELFANVPMS